MTKHIPILHLQRLDARYSLHLLFQYRVEFLGLVHLAERVQRFVEIRNWCWETFGPGIERVAVGYGSLPKFEWAWHCDPGGRELHIYLKEENLTHFQLKWM